MNKSKLSNLMDFANNEVEKITFNPHQPRSIRLHNDTQESLRSLEFKFPKTTKNQTHTQLTPIRPLKQKNQYQRSSKPNYTESTPGNKKVGNFGFGNRPKNS